MKDFEPDIRLHIERREPFANSMSFDTVGPYERFSGRVFFAVNPDDHSYSQVVDLKLAPRNDRGLVTYECDLDILAPTEPARGNKRIVYDVNNRGNKRILQFFCDAVGSNHPTTVEHAGNGFLLRQGYTIVWSGWQGDLLPGEGRMTIRVPTAGTAERPITGRVRSEFVVEEPGIRSLPLSGNDFTRSYEAASLNPKEAALSYREYAWDPRASIDSDSWQFATCGPDGQVLSSTRHCFLPAGFQPGWIYELIYPARDPLVLGLGFTTVRDFIAFLLHREVDSEDTPNPLSHSGGRPQRAYAWGRSQSGRFLREFVYRGFNEDHAGRRVFDAVWPHVAGAGRLALNYRFAQPGRYPQHHKEHAYPSDQFPFAYTISRDQFVGKSDGILKRPTTDPFVFHTQTSSEYWERRGSLVHTDGLGNDLPCSGKARTFLFASSQHLMDPVAGPEQGAQEHPSNPLNTTPFLRALLEALDAWVTTERPPPDNAVPTRTDATLVPAPVVSTTFPRIPGVRCPAEPNRLMLQDHGPDVDHGLLSREPPGEDASQEYAVLVPQVDPDGNDLAGIRTPHVSVPLATFTGWNWRPRGAAQRALAGVIGSWFPFAPTEEVRGAQKDPRPSIAERYRSRAEYVRAIAEASKVLIGRRLLLEEDARRFVEAAVHEIALKNLDGIENRESC